jgi:MscS family membrane protein
MEIIWQTNTLMNIGIILLLTAGFAYAARRILTKFKGLPATSMWLKTLGDSLYNHSNWVIWTIGSLFALDQVVHIESCPVPSDLYTTVVHLVLVVIFTWLLIIWKGKVEKALLAKASKKESSVGDRELISVVGKLTTVLLLIVVGFMILDILDVPFQALLAFGGIGSLAVSWAAKDVIANFFGGAMIFINRPFVVGDWIKSPNKNFEGVVEEIGWYMTRIRLFERIPTFIPNAVIIDAIIENPGRMYNRRIKKTIGVRYDDVKKVPEIVDKIEEMLRHHPEIDQNQFLFVHFVEFGPYSLDINIYTFTKTTKWARFRTIQQDVLLKIADIIDGCGAEIAFPTNTIHLQPKDHSG